MLHLQFLEHVFSLFNYYSLQLQDVKELQLERLERVQRMSQELICRQKSLITSKSHLQVSNQSWKQFPYVTKHLFSLIWRPLDLVDLIKLFSNIPP